MIKCLFVDAPLWRVWGLDQRIDAELARMALDLADERRSARRPVNLHTWLCLGTQAGERGLESIEIELTEGDSRARAAAAVGLARAGEHERLTSLVAVENDALVRDTMRAALEGRHERTAFRRFDPAEQS